MTNWPGEDDLSPEMRKKKKKRRKNAAGLSSRVWKVSFFKPLTNAWVLKGIKYFVNSLRGLRLQLFPSKTLQHGKPFKDRGWLNIDQCRVLIVMVGPQ